MKQIYGSHFITLAFRNQKPSAFARKAYVFVFLLFSVSFLSAQLKIVGLSNKDAGTIFSLDSTNASVQTLINLNEFNLPSRPVGALVGFEGKFWGVSRNGGEFGKGTIFNMNPDGTGVAVVYSFANQDGFNPEAGLTLNEGILWGTTTLGGTSNLGVVFTWDLANEAYTKLVDFDSTNGATPMSPLAVIDGKVWGSTMAGGTNNVGTIFTINPDGTGFSTIHEFQFFNGQNPSNLKLIEIGGKVWGATDQGGDLSPGVIFSIDVTTLAFTEEYEFDASGGDEWWEPYGSFTLSNGKIWGTARGGGNGGAGVIFNINTDGTGLTKVHDFVISEGEEANGGLVEADGKLWGKTLEGGQNGDGVVFSIDTDGTNFTKVLDLDGDSFGRFSTNPLAVLENKVYGMTEVAGLYDQGTVFSVDPTNNQSELVRALNQNDLAYGLESRLTDAYGKLWGVSETGGPANAGNIFSMDRDGTNFTVVHNFDREVSGAELLGSLLPAFDRLWGILPMAGTNQSGLIYSLNETGGDFTIHHEFGQGSDGAFPSAELTLANGKIYGATFSGGSDLRGTIFSLNADGSNYQSIASFNAQTGSIPEGRLLDVNGKLWGVTIGEDGTLFTVDYDGSNLTTAVSFPDLQGGKLPSSNLTVVGDKIFGYTQGDNLGDNVEQTLFAIGNDGTNFQVVQSFNDNSTTTGFGTRGKLIEAGGLLWGVNTNGGVNVNGTVFTIDPTSLAVNVVHSFNGAVDASLPSGGLTPYGGKLWGFTESGGLNSRGIIYSIATDGTDFQVESPVNLGDFGGELANIPLYVVKNLAELQVDTTTYTYGDDGFTFSVLSDEAQAYEFLSSDGQVINMIGDSAVITGAGTSLVATFHTETETFKADSLETQITVLQAPLSITAGNLTRMYAEPNPDFAFSYNGFVYEEDSTALLSLPEGTTTATIDSDVGTYDITAAGAESDNYTISYVGGTLTITQATQEITFPELETKTVGDADFNLTATTSSTLPVSYTASNDSVVIINDDLVTIIGEGTVEITARQIGNNNYLAAESVSRTLIVQASVSTNIADALDISQAIYPNPATRQFQLQTDFNYLEVTLYDIEGRVVKKFSKQNSYFVGDLPTGTYLVELRNTEEAKKGRLIVR